MTALGAAAHDRARARQERAEAKRQRRRERQRQRREQALPEREALARELAAAEGLLLQTGLTAPALFNRTWATRERLLAELERLAWHEQGQRDGAQQP